MLDGLGHELSVGDKILVSYNDPGYIGTVFVYAVVEKLAGKGRVYFECAGPHKHMRTKHRFIDASRVAKNDWDDDD